MSNIERMTIVVSEQMSAEIHAAVEAGEYASTSEAVRDAVRLWSRDRKLRAREITDLRKAWDAGKRSGVAGRYDMKAIVRGARATKAKASRKPRG